CERACNPCAGLAIRYRGLTLFATDAHTGNTPIPMKQMTFADAEYAGKRKQRRVCNGGMAAARCSRRLKTQK
ncbi:hypothetical protein ACET4K_31295, partial [Pseudomonas aeruginosa]